MRRTKIVCTLGPATDSREMIRALIDAGMDVARLNFSHGTHEDHARRLALLREEASCAGRVVGALQDLQGPKIRTGPLAKEEIELKAGQRFVITIRSVPGDEQAVSTDYEALPRDVAPGDRMLLSDGLIELRVQETTDTDVVTEIVYGGSLRPHQGINLPGVRVSAPSVTAKDLDDLRFGLEHGVDYVAISFVRHPDDVSHVRRIIAEAGKDTPLIAKLEKPEALEHLDEILAVADGVMVARGDMGVEMSPEQVPVMQKRIIRRANEMARPVITATQMLESMIQHPRPTRAEVSDVANAILDGSDAVMLSGETAIGSYPVLATEMLARIAETIEGDHRDREELVPWMLREVPSIPHGIGAAVAAICRAMSVRAVCVLTRSGATARIVSHYRPTVPILAFTPYEETLRRLSLLWGVVPIRNLYARTEEEYYDQVQTLLLDLGWAQEGDRVVLTGGHPVSEAGPTNFLKIMTVQRPKARPVAAR
ncbi:MAG: pyruvate kinase [Chloroflexi bacterium]|nr:pyruvate kinase [Chloroflexota bacterium]